MSSAVRCTSGCTVADGAGSMAAIETLASTTMLCMSSEENSANRIATADATKTLARMRDETEGRRFRKGFVNSPGSGSSSRRPCVVCFTMMLTLLNVTTGTLEYDAGGCAMVDPDGIIP